MFVSNVVSSHLNKLSKKHQLNQKSRKLDYSNKKYAMSQSQSQHIGLGALWLGLARR